MTTTVRILVVDDEVNIRGALVTLLERKGYQVRGAGTGEDALEQLESATADLVLTDLNSFAGSRRNGLILKSWL